MAFTIETLDKQLARIDALGQALISRDRELEQNQQTIAQERNDIARQVLHLQGQATMVHMLKDEAAQSNGTASTDEGTALSIVPNGEAEGEVPNGG